MPDLPAKWITALPVYNEATYVEGVLDEVTRYSPRVLVVDDGSTDATPDLLAARNDVTCIRHSQNRGYGAALRSAFEFAMEHRFEVVVTIDCDGQHEPQRVGQFASACGDVDIVSGSRYLEPVSTVNQAPEQRRRINVEMTEWLNRRLGLQLTDAFCGFKAYRVDALRRLDLQETGYAMPLELWVQAVACDLRIRELAVPLIYLDESRSFGGELDDGDTRRAHYYDVLNKSMRRAGRSGSVECTEGSE